MPTAEEIIAHFELQPHPKEGGFFRETYRSMLLLGTGALPDGYVSARAASTAIYYLLRPGTVSRLHRLCSDEMFHFYLGDPVQMLQLDQAGKGRTIILGPDVLHGQEVQTLVAAGVWQGSMLVPGGRFALLGCTVAPGFEYADYQVGTSALAECYPEFAELIHALTA